MMPADTQYVLRARLDRQIGARQAGTFGIVNQDPTAQIVVTLQTDAGSGPQADTFYLRKQGETLTMDRATLIAATIEAQNAAGAASYPATILLVDTDLTVSVTSLASAVAGGSETAIAANGNPNTLCPLAGVGTIYVDLLTNTVYVLTALPCTWGLH